MSDDYLITAQENPLDARVTLTVIGSFLVAATGGLLFGYDIGATSVTCTDTQMFSRQNFDVQDEALKGLFRSMSLYGALVASFGISFVAGRLGRRGELIISSAMYCAGSLLVFSSRELNSFAKTGDETLGIILCLTGKCVYGVGIGIAMHSAPTYISEIAPISKRGLMVSLKEGFIVVGILFGYLMGFLFQMPTGWKGVYIVPAVVSLCMYLGTLWIPRSPRWLALRHKEKPSSYTPRHALDALYRLREGRNTMNMIENEMQEIWENLEDSDNDFSFAPTWREMFRDKRALFIGCGLIVFQQITGQPSVLYYTSTIFESAGFAKSDNLLASVIVGTMKLIATSITVLKVDSFGRRPLLLIGIFGMIVSLAIVGVAFLYKSEETDPDDPSSFIITLPTAWAYTTVGAIMLLVTSYQIGFGPISWLMISEIFPLRTRSLALSFATLLNFGSNILMTQSLGLILTSLGESTTFFCFAAVCVLSGVFVYKYVPETKGKSLEEIETMLGLGAQTHPSSVHAFAPVAEVRDTDDVDARYNENIRQESSRSRSSKSKHNVSSEGLLNGGL